jgi:purine-cytosine permease-like protein
LTAIYYSASISIQLWGKPFMAVPRFLWNSLLAAISLAIAWGGREHLATILTNFLSLLGYWTICFGAILAIEHFWFRPHHGGYNLEGWQDQDLMPYGFAACASLVLGVGVSFLGMNQTWVSRLSTNVSCGCSIFWAVAEQSDTVCWASGQSNRTVWR